MFGQIGIWGVGRPGAFDEDSTGEQTMQNMTFLEDDLCYLPHLILVLM